MDLSNASVGNLTATQRDQLMSEVKQQLAVANAQELLTVSKNEFSTNSTVRQINAISSFILQKITEKCFKKCVNKPGTSLGSSEQVNSSSHNSVPNYFKRSTFFFLRWTEMHSDVYGSFHGLLEFNFSRIYAKNTKRTGRWWLLNGIGASRILLRSKFHRNTYLVSRMHWLQFKLSPSQIKLRNKNTKVCAWKLKWIRHMQTGKKSIEKTNRWWNRHWIKIRNVQIKLLFYCTHNNIEKNGLRIQLRYRHQLRKLAAFEDVIWAPSLVGVTLVDILVFHAFYILACWL